MRVSPQKAENLLLSSPGASNIEFIRYEPGEALPVEQLALKIYRSMRSRRRDRVAVMSDGGTLEALEPKLGAEYLKPGRNYHWSGVQWRAQKGRKRILLGDYEDWFKWYMGQQRFKAFHVVVMVEPWAATSDEGRGGYFDGFLARLVHNIPSKVIVVETGRQTTAKSPGPLYLQEALLSILYGTRLSRDELVEIAGRAFVPLRDDEALHKSLADRWLWKRHHSRYELTETGEEFLEGMAPPKPSYGMDPLEVKPLFEPRKRAAARYTLPNSLLKEMLLEDVKENGWVTAYDEWPSMSMKLEALAREDGSKIWNFFQHREVTKEVARETLAPSPRLLRWILDELVEEGRLVRRTWFREVGRPTFAYCLPGRVPFLEQRCGQCAFYIPLRMRCRLWWLVDKAYANYNPRWKEAGSGVSRFDVHKMKNSWRIGPHSSACTRFLDKKRDHLRKAIPQACEVCANAISASQGQFLVSCTNCGTKFVRFRDKVKVLTAYEHEFRRLYIEIAGADPREDLRRWETSQAQTAARIMERAIHATAAAPLAETLPNEKGAELPRWLPIKFDVGLQEQVDRLAKTTDISRLLSIAMAKSAINATKRLAALVKLDKKLEEPAIKLQGRYLSSLQLAGPHPLTHEALIMKQYWHVFDLALKPALTWFGPRKEARFVREYVTDPAGRERGYTAVDAAVNYSHRRRLLQAQRINAEVGFGERSCDGFIHKRRYNSSGVGLLLDMIDPFKFADREKLLEAVLSHKLNWRDFNIATDRHGVNFYYPTTESIEILEQIGEEADKMLVTYKTSSIPLSEAFHEVAFNLLRTLHQRSSDYTPFIFGE